jgi:hypothetical protein
MRQTLDSNYRQNINHSNEMYKACTDSIELVKIISIKILSRPYCRHISVELSL